VPEIGRHRVRKLDRQAVLQRGADQVFRAEARAGVHEEDVVGQVPQTRTQEEGLHQGQPHVLKMYNNCYAHVSRQLCAMYRVSVEKKTLGFIKCL